MREEIKQRKQIRVTMRHNDSFQQLHDLQWQQDANEVAINDDNDDYEQVSNNEDHTGDLRKDDEPDLTRDDVVIDDSQPCHRMAICSYNLDDHLLNNDFFHVPFENFFHR